MASFFRRKKDKDAAAGSDRARKGGLDIEALAAAFPKAPGSTGTTPARTAPAREDEAAEDAAPPEAPPRDRDGATGAAPAAAVVETAPPAVAVPPPAPPQTLAPTPAAGPEPEPAPSSATREKPAAAPGRPGWRERLRGTGFARGLGGLFSR